MVMHYSAGARILFYIYGISKLLETASYNIMNIAQKQNMMQNIQQYSLYLYNHFMKIDKMVPVFYTLFLVLTLMRRI